MRLVHAIACSLSCAFAFGGLPLPDHAIEMFRFESSDVQHRREHFALQSLDARHLHEGRGDEVVYRLVDRRLVENRRGREVLRNGKVRISVNDLIDEVRHLKRDGRPLLEDPMVRDQLVQLMMEEKSLGLADKRTALGDLNSDYPMSLPLSFKLRVSEYQRRMRQYGLEMQGGLGSLYVGDEEALAGGFWQRAYFNNFSTTIGGGTSEIQRNIIGEQVLGLPKS